MIMWPDNETATDLLGFRVHSGLIKSVVTDPNVLPVTLGIFGDWGGGKSSVMKMLQQELETSDDSGVVCLSFNGWMFEGYDDAKSALISSVLLQMGEHKRLGPRIRGKIIPLLKQVRWMRVLGLGMKHIVMPLLSQQIAGDPAISSTLAPFLPLPTLSPQVPAEDGNHEPVAESVDWQQLMGQDARDPGPVGIRTFRDQFEQLLKDSDVRSLVVLIDDLDRCSPERIIENLEAIKLFLAVPRTAFIIGADPRIVRHAIAVRYGVERVQQDRTAAEEPYDLVTDYLEKLIQVPYHLPRLSPSEVETYINLLLCQRHLEQAAFDALLTVWTSKRRENQYACCRYQDIADMLAPDSVPVELAHELGWSNAIAPALAEGMKGNPRQVKRMLNAMVLRRELARTAGIEIRDDILAKLMVLEYVEPELFTQLHGWQAVQDGFPSQLRDMELATLSQAPDDRDVSIPDSWRRASVDKWLSMTPPLSRTDLRDYFWIARDRRPLLFGGARMVAPVVRRLYTSLVGDDEGEQHVAAKEVITLGSDELDALLKELSSHVRRNPGDQSGPRALLLLADYDIPNSVSTLTSSLGTVLADHIPPNVLRDLGTMAKTKPNARDTVMPFLRRISDPGSPAGRAAQKALEELD